MLMIFQLVRCSDKFTDKQAIQPNESEVKNIDEEGFNIDTAQLENLQITGPYEQTTQPPNQPDQPSYTEQPEDEQGAVGGVGEELRGSNGDDSDGDENFDVIVRELEDLIEEDDSVEDTCKESKQDNQPLTQAIEVDWQTKPEEQTTNVNNILEIVLLKRGPDGSLIPMNITDYAIKGYDQYGIKFELNSPLEMLVSKKEVVWVHEQNKGYPLQLMYKDKKDIFILIFKYLSFVYKRVGDHWNLRILRPPKGIRMYDIDKQGRVYPINHNQYIVQPTGLGSFRYILKQGIKCRIVEYQNCIVWGRDPSAPYVRTFSYVNDNLFIIFFRNHIVKVIRINNEWFPITLPRLSKLTVPQF
ncbi:Theileria-specific sub-telomeric protein, SVSP family, putative [Theileria annulata]|uniref:Theileria-specific sub-telomeric protein, SVSP family, putative n=1 Tax=Theileria annulata TaxID=5874 RepID=Q4UAR7_THEAN|nr:Theileria-specific sub-telomeric protein, SVSP family, putative [Theileria annulata]CAI76084.1 Theileria-specific sub-telomeric protein, SVSP family, putative [Theileria annulata]|eukprot:XP_952710.1 Theileria-specific sub-telomeric protein, SVSP family, putative [Theileria annulata]